jgi:hypothetical protein
MPHREDVWESGCVVPLLLTSALDGGEWSASRPGRYTPEESALDDHCTVSCVGSTAGLNAEKKRISWPCRELNSGRPSRSYTNRGIPFPHYGEAKLKYRTFLIKCDFSKKSNQWSNKMSIEFVPHMPPQTDDSAAIFKTCTFMHSLIYAYAQMLACFVRNNAISRF